MNGCLKLSTKHITKQLQSHQSIDCYRGKSCAIEGELITRAPCLHYLSCPHLHRLSEVDLLRQCVQLCWQTVKGSSQSVQGIQNIAEKSCMGWISAHQHTTLCPGWRVLNWPSHSIAWYPQRPTCAASFQCDLACVYAGRRNWAGMEWAKPWNTTGSAPC